MKDFEHVNFDKVNPLYLVFDNVNGYIIEKKVSQMLDFCFCRQKQRNIKTVHRTLKWN